MLLSVWCELEFSGGLIKEVIVIFFPSVSKSGHRVELSIFIFNKFLCNTCAFGLESHSRNHFVVYKHRLMNSYTSCNPTTQECLIQYFESEQAVKLLLTKE